VVDKTQYIFQCIANWFARLIIVHRTGVEIFKIKKQKNGNPHLTKKIVRLRIEEVEIEKNKTFVVSMVFL